MKEWRVYAMVQGKRVSLVQGFKKSVGICQRNVGGLKSMDLSDTVFPSA